MDFIIEVWGGGRFVIAAPGHHEAAVRYIRAYNPPVGEFFSTELAKPFTRSWGSCRRGMVWSVTPNEGRVSRRCDYKVPSPMKRESEDFFNELWHERWGPRECRERAFGPGKAVSAFEP